MRTYNHNFTCYEAFELFVSQHQISEDSTLLIQYFDGMLNVENSRELLEYLSTKFRNAHIIGTSTDGEIFNETVQDHSVILSFSIFESVTLASLSVSLDEGSFTAGEELGREATRFGAQAMIVFSDAFATNGDLLMEGFTQHSNNVILAGGMAGDNGKFQSTYVISGAKLYSKRAVAIMLKGENLRVNNGYSFHWLPIGPTFRVTHSVDNIVYTLDDRPILEVYRDYLGDSVADTLQSVGVAFPLILKQKSQLIGRAPLISYEDGALGFGGSIPQGAKVQFGIGNANLILESSRETFNSCLTQSPESIFVYSCMARRRFLGDAIGMETIPLHTIAPTSGFFTYGEFYTDPKNYQSSLLNETMTFLILSENDTKPLSIDSRPSTDTKEWSLITFGALSHLVTKTTDELQSLNHSLQQRVKEQVGEIRAKEKIMLAQSKRATMGEMLNMIAHQWRQPIAAIGLISDNLLLDLTLDGVDERKVKESIANIQKRIHHLSKTIDDFGNYFGSESRLETIHVYELFNELIVIVGKSLESHSIMFVPKINPDLMIHCNYREVIQICLNVINNAKDAILERGIENGIIEFEHNRQFHYDLICIQDNGGGVSPEIEEKIFEPYFSTKSEKNGTGLGLYMSKTIAQDHLGGDLAYLSTPNGSRFCLSIPRHDGEA
jgi:signal transduction histidine kinase